MRRKQLIAEIETSLKNYSEAGLIDYRSLNFWLDNSLKLFGNNLMQLTEEVIAVENGQADLPKTFYNLHLAAKCDEVKQEECESSLLPYVQVRDYTNHKLLRLTKGIKRELCATSCINKSLHKIPNIHHCPFEMNIINDKKAHFNFKQGFVYIQYYGMPTDEDGDLFIPDITPLIKYLITHCQRKIVESLLLNDDDPNVINKLNYLKQEEREQFSLAMTAVKFSALGSWDEKLKAKNRKEMMKYESLFPC